MTALTGPPPLQAFLDPYLAKAEAHFIVEGVVALIAALFAIALRRQRRRFKSPGFIMIAAGLILDMLVPGAGSASIWKHYSQAIALTLVAFGVIRLAVEGGLVAVYGRKADPSTIVAEIFLASVYGAIALIVMRFMLNVDPRVLFAVPAVGTLLAGWILQGNFFSGLLLQYRRPYMPGDWVRLGQYTGRVAGSGWRATRLITRSNENLQVPNTLIAKELLVNYSSHSLVADEIFIGLSYDTPPSRVEQVVHNLLSEIPEVRKSEVDLWDYEESAVRYRIRYWFNDYFAQEQIRTRINRGLWYALRRNSIEIPLPGRRIVTSQAAVLAPSTLNHDGQSVIRELRRVYLLNALSDEELRILLPSVRVSQFGRGEILIREGEQGECFYVLRRGAVDIVAKDADGHSEKYIKRIDDTSPDHFFGEIALLTGEPRNATIRASSDVEVFEIGRDGFTSLFRAKPEAGATLAEVAARRAAETEQLRASSTQTAAALRSPSRILLAMRKAFDF